MSRSRSRSRSPILFASAAALFAATPTLAAQDATATAAPAEPLAGFSDGTAFLRSADNAFQLFPSGRLQIDGYYFKGNGNKTPQPGFITRRARLEAAGWVGRMFFFQIAGDFAAAPNTGLSNLNATDDFVGIAPWGDLAILQVGQFNAPFTLENRTSNKYFDFIERSITVRAFGAPSNKELGAMVHGVLPRRFAHYSLGVFDGDGQNLRNQDDAFDVIGRAWIAPFALVGPEWLAAVTVGGSRWMGKRKSPLTQALPGQSTQGGFTFFSPKWTGTPATMGAAAPAYQVNQAGDLSQWAVELNAPLGHRLGLRAEWVWKRQELATVSTQGTAALVPMASGRLRGWSGYGEVWGWLVGDGRLIGTPGLQLPHRFVKFGTKPPAHGLMLAARLERLDEKLIDDAGAPALGNPNLGTTRVTALTLGINYWHSKRFRATFNHVFNRFGGDTAAVGKLPSRVEHEFLFRLAAAL